jgi:prepilin-type N-terminal cleavage/methylation domain-containing protein
MKKGFTLIEASVALAILGALVYMASISILGVIPKYKLEKAVWEIRSALNSARYRAVFEEVSVRVKLSAGSYAVEKYNESEKRWTLAEKHLLDGVTVDANNSPLFTPQGTVSGLASIIISNSWGKYKITMAITGRIKTTRLN